MIDDFARAAKVRRAMNRAPWRPFAFRLAVLIFDYMGLARGRCELGVGALARELLNQRELEGLDEEERRRRQAAMKRAVKRGLQDLGDVLVTEAQGDGKRSHRWLRTDLILARWGDTTDTPSQVAGGDTTDTPSTDRGDTTDTPPGSEGVTRRTPGGCQDGHRGGDTSDTGLQEDLLEDLLEDPSRARATGRESPVELPLFDEKPSAAGAASGPAPPSKSKKPPDPREVESRRLRKLARTATARAYRRKGKAVPGRRLAHNWHGWRDLVEFARDTARIAHEDEGVELDVDELLVALIDASVEQFPDKPVGFWLHRLGETWGQIHGARPDPQRERERELIERIEECRDRGDHDGREQAQAELEALREEVAA